MTEINDKVIAWAKARNLTDNVKVRPQMLKLMEELGELSGAIARNDTDKIKDSLGDMQVVLVILGEQLGLPADEALESAYSVIENRTGKTVNGVFIKDGE